MFLFIFNTQTTF